MKNKITILLLVVWLFCGLVMSSLVSSKAASSETKSVSSSLPDDPQISTTTSYDDLNVYASADLSENSPSSLSYRITITITSPSGRSNTTQSDWSPAPLSHKTGLSIKDEDGSYSVQTKFESQNGSYDDYGNFAGTGSPNLLANRSGAVDVPPLITLTNLVFIPPTISAIAGTTSELVATVTYSRSVPQNTTVEMEVNDSPIGAGNPLYNINNPSFDPTNGGVLIPNSGNREVLLKVPAASSDPRSVRVTFPFVLSQNTGSGSVNANVRLGNVQPQPSPTIQINPPLGLNAVLTISPTPTPSPSPTPRNGGGGGGVGQGPGNPPCPPPGQNSRVLLDGTEQPDPCSSPIVIDVLGDGYNLTSNAGGVFFDLT